MEDRKEHTASWPRSQASMAAVESLAEICSLVPREAERMEIVYEEWLKGWEKRTKVGGKLSVCIPRWSPKRLWVLRKQIQWYSIILVTTEMKMKLDIIYLTTKIEEIKTDNRRRRRAAQRKRSCVSGGNRNLQACWKQTSFKKSYDFEQVVSVRLDDPNQSISHKKLKSLNKIFIEEFMGSFIYNSYVHLVPENLRLHRSQRRTYY